MSQINKFEERQSTEALLCKNWSVQIWLDNPLFLFFFILQRFATKSNGAHFAKKNPTNMCTWMSIDTRGWRPYGRARWGRALPSTHSILGGGEVGGKGQTMPSSEAGQLEGEVLTVSREVVAKGLVIWSVYTRSKFRKKNKPKNMPFTQTGTK